MRSPSCIILAFALYALSFSPTALAQERQALGMIMDDAAYEMVPRSAPLMRGSYEMPASTSLRKYAPTPGHQGNSGTCVGWATAYSARTIIAAMQNGWTDQATIDANAFSPSYVYNRLKGTSGTDVGCTRGTHIPYALGVMQENGALELDDFPFDCNRGVTIRDDEKAEDNRILEFSRLFHQESANKVLPVKKSLADGKPVVIGMLVPLSFMNSRGELWEPSPNDPPVTPYDGHAMTVIAYDDNMYGGAVQLMNSWGTRWGDGGFTWVKYDDFAQFVKYGFDVFAAQERPSDVPRLAGSLTFRLANGSKMTASRGGNLYRMEEVYASQTEFEGFITNEQPAYVYAFATDLTRKVTKLVPVDSTTSPFLSSPGADVSLTGDYTFYLDDRAGIDWLAVLYSAKPLNMKAIVASVEVGEGTFEQRVSAALGSDLADPGSVMFEESSIAFRAMAGSGSVVPLIVEIEHVGVDTGRDVLPPRVTVLTPPAAPDVPTKLYAIPGTETVMIRGTVQDESGIGYLLVNGVKHAVDASGAFAIPLAFAAGQSSVEVVVADNEGNRTTYTYEVVPNPVDPDPPEVTIESPRVMRGKTRGIGVRKPGRSQTVTGTLYDASAIAGVYVNGTAATVTGNRFTVDLRLASGQNVLKVVALDTYGNKMVGDYQILDQGESEDVFRASPTFIEGDQDYVTVNVYYGTDRAATGSTVPAEFYSGARGELVYGRAGVSIPKGHTVGELEAPAWWRFEFSEDPAEHVMVMEVVPMGRETTLDEIRGTVSRSDSKSAFVFIHGYNVSFEDAARRTGQMAFDLGFDGAPIFYSWPSDASLTAYTRDEADVAWTVPNLVRFLEDIAKRSGAESVHVIAHSMGNRAVTDALMRFAQRDEGPMFDQVLLTAPDVDADIFARDIAPMIPKTAKRVTLYASSKDKALMASKKVHGYARAGDSGSGLIVLTGIDTIDASDIDTDMLGHSYFAQTEPILRDISEVMGEGLAPSQRSLLPRIKDVLTYWLLQVVN